MVNLLQRRSPGNTLLALTLGTLVVTACSDSSDRSPAPPAEATPYQEIYDQGVLRYLGEYTPMTLIQDQWTTFFEEDFEETHKGVTDPNHGDVPVTEALTEEELEDLEDRLAFARRRAAAQNTRTPSSSEIASTRWSNCTVKGFSRTFRHQGRSWSRPPGTRRPPSAPVSVGSCNVRSRGTGRSSISLSAP